MAVRSRITALAQLSILGRVALAAGGGYGIAALATALLSLTLPMTRSEAVTTATLLSFAVIAGFVVLVFAMRTFLRAFLTVAATGLVLGGLLWLAMGGSAP